MKPLTLRRWVFGALGIASLSGCSPQSAVIARVGPRVITVEDFEAAARVNWSQYPGNPEQAKHMLLDDLLRRDLLLEIADSRGLERDSSVVRLKRTAEQQVLLAAIGQQLAPRSIPVSDAEVATFYDWSGTRAHLLLVYCNSRVAAEAVAFQLRAGRRFADVANQFTPAGLLPPGGDLGEIASGALVDPLDAFIREAPIGVIQGPVEAPGEGWFVARVLSRRRVPQKATFEVQRPILADMLRQRKQRLASTRAFQALRDQYRIAVERGAPQELFALFNTPQPEGHDRYAVPAPDRSHVMARYIDASGAPRLYTLGEALDDLRLPDNERPAPSMTPAIEEWLQQQVMRRVALLEARRRGIGLDPTVSRTIEERANNAMLEIAYQLAVASGVDAGDADVRAAFERHAIQYQRLLAVRIQRVAFDDSAGSDRLLRHGGHSGTLRDAAKMAGMEDKVVEERVSFPNPDPLWKAMEPNLQSMSIGEWAGPVKTAQGWNVLQVIDKEMLPLTFEALSPAIQQGLRQEAIGMIRDRRLAAVTDSLKRITRPFEVHPEVLKRVPWPPIGAMN
ncbi:MAG: peptidyl-prolyl cis-trans isomerase [Candidatus Eisenbacteria bacterium]|nr:peptidyl-prolyl cis-trans isomerase [Candidatus Eisenbacteria bacterium]